MKDLVKLIEMMRKFPLVTDILIVIMLIKYPQLFRVPHLHRNLCCCFGSLIALMCVLEGSDRKAL